MTPIKVDFSGVSTDEFTALPEGQYKVRVFEVTKETSRNGDPYLSWVFRVTQPKEFTGRRAWHNSSLQTQALWALKRLLVALGVGPEDLQGEIEIEPADFIGSECVIRIGHETYQGEVRQRVLRAMPANTPLEGESAESDFDFDSVSIPAPKGGDTLE
jgi:hypothetical protein